MFWATRNPLLTNDKIKTGIFKNFNYFSKMWRIRDKYKVDKIGVRANPWPTPILTLKKREEKLF